MMENRQAVGGLEDVGKRVWRQRRKQRRPEHQAGNDLADHPWLADASRQPPEHPGSSNDHDQLK